MDKSTGKTRPRSDAVELRFLERVSGRLPEDLQVLQALAELYTKTGRYEDGLAIDRRLCRARPGDDLAWYNLACSYALTNRPDEAFEALTKAVELGYGDYDWMKADPDLNGLHDDPRFESLLSWLYTACTEDEGPPF